MLRIHKTPLLWQERLTNSFVGSRITEKMRSLHAYDTAHPNVQSPFSGIKKHSWAKATYCPPLVRVTVKISLLEVPGSHARMRPTEHFNLGSCSISSPWTLYSGNLQNLLPTTVPRSLTLHSAAIEHTFLLHACTCNNHNILKH